MALPVNSGDPLPRHVDFRGCQLVHWHVYFAPWRGLATAGGVTATPSSVSVTLRGVMVISPGVTVTHGQATVTPVRVTVAPYLTLWGQMIGCRRLVCPFTTGCFVKYSGELYICASTFGGSRRHFSHFDKTFGL